MWLIPVALWNIDVEAIFLLNFFIDSPPPKSPEAAVQDNAGSFTPEVTLHS